MTGSINRVAMSQMYGGYKKQEKLKHGGFFFNLNATENRKYH